jgi:hypothetical protein
MLAVLDATEFDQEIAGKPESDPNIVVTNSFVPPGSPLYPDVAVLNAHNHMNPAAPGEARVGQSGRFTRTSDWENPVPTKRSLAEQRPSTSNDTAVDLALRERSSNPAGKLVDTNRPAVNSDAKFGCYFSVINFPGGCTYKACPNNHGAPACADAARDLVVKAFRYSAHHGLRVPDPAQYEAGMAWRDVPLVKLPAAAKSVTFLDEAASDSYISERDVE